MGTILTLPNFMFGPGSLAKLAEQLTALGIERSLLISDRGIERAGLLAGLPEFAAHFIDVVENPIAQGADAAADAYRQAHCDGIVALGGGSVIDTAKIVSALVVTVGTKAADLIGQPTRIESTVPLIAIPTTVGTGSESSPVAALHLVAGGPAVGTRHPLLVPYLAICDPDLARTLPRHLLAATSIDALSHCLEGFFAEPGNPLIDALALDGAARIFKSLHAALNDDGEEARGSLMAAAFFGGVAIHKGLGPAHAVALACSDQHLHHGTLIGIILPRSMRLLAAQVPDKAARLRAAIGLDPDADLGAAIQQLMTAADVPSTLAAAGYRVDDAERLANDMARSHFNLTSAYVPTREEYCSLLAEIA